MPLQAWLHSPHESPPQLINNCLRCCLFGNDPRSSLFSVKPYQPVRPFVSVSSCTWAVVRAVPFSKVSCNMKKRSKIVLFVPVKLRPPARMYFCISGGRGSIGGGPDYGRLPILRLGTSSMVGGMAILGGLEAWPCSGAGGRGRGHERGLSLFAVSMTFGINTRYLQCSGTEERSICPPLSCSCFWLFIVRF